MRRLMVLMVLALLAWGLSCGYGFALTLGENITINDLMPNPGIGVGGEDNECEAGMVQNQAWDLEGFFLDGFTLAMVGGYDFVNGLDGYTSGDIFIDVDGEVDFGGDDSNANRGVNDIYNTFGYDYVLDINFTESQYSVFAIDSNTILQSVHYNDLNAGSNPWQFDNSKNNLIALAGFANVAFDYKPGLSDTDVQGLSGEYDVHSVTPAVTTHNAALFDVSFLGYGTAFTVHNTMGCGNDNLMGHGTTPVPEPGTVVLMLLGVGALFGGQRLRRRKA